MRKSTKWSAMLLALGSAMPAMGALIVNVGSTSVGVGQTATVLVTVSNSTSAAISDIEGMTFTLQIAAGTGTTPKITSIDLLTGTVWASHSNGSDIFPVAGGNLSQYESLGILTDAGGEFINANGLLATVTIDTTGATGGNYALDLVGTKTAGDDSVFDDDIGLRVPATFNAGQLTVVVPEPELWAAGILVVVPLARRRRAARR